MTTKEQETNPKVIEASAPDDLSPEQREQYDRAVQTAVQAVDDFITNHPEYKQTDENKQAILDYLDAHDLAISPGSLELCCEQLRGRLDLENSESDSQADGVRGAGVEALGKSAEKPAEESPKEIEDNSARGKPVAWRNGRRIGVAA